MHNVVTIWWGTGTYNVLSALKNISNINISCIVSMSDDGWSSGRLRDEYWVLPPWDLRRALVALSDDDKTQILRQIFAHRFKAWSLEWHNLGNLIMMALEQINTNFGKAISMLEELFDVKWKIYPVTFEKTRLVAQLENLDYIIWETNIDIPKHNPDLEIKDLYVVKEEYISVLEKINNEQGLSYSIKQSVCKEFLEDTPKANPQISQLLEKADFIVFAPWDLYTSILPNILTGQVSKYIINSQAKKLFFVNLFTKHWETTDFDLSDFLDVFKGFFGKDIFDNIFMQDWEHFSIQKDILDKYTQENKSLVKQDIQDDRIIKANFVKQHDMIRHDPNKIQNFLKEFFDKS